MTTIEEIIAKISEEEKDIISAIRRLFEETDLSLGQCKQMIAKHRKYKHQAETGNELHEKIIEAISNKEFE